MSEEPERLAEGTLLSHLLELRDRLLRAFLAVIVAFVPCAIYADEIFSFLAQPLLEKLPKGGSLIATSVISPFMTPFKLAFFVAVFIAMPVVLYQLWAFVAPGLYRHEKRLAMPLLVLSVLLFYVGCAFAYFFVLPAVFAFMTHIAPAGVAVMPDINHYLSFVLGLFFAFGLCFEVPVVLILLVAMHAVTIEQLRSSRRYMIVAAFAIAAVLTPPDVLSQVMLAVPMILLYEVGIVGARLLTRGAATTPDAPSAPG